ncbi:MAG: DUF3426 domain-containing protein [Syntrophobacteraceae bacterium]
MNRVLSIVMLMIMLFNADSASAFHNVNEIKLFGIKLGMTPEDAMAHVQKLFHGQQADLREKEGDGGLEYEIHISEARQEIYLTFDSKKRLCWAEYEIKYKNGFSSEEVKVAIAKSIQEYGTYDDICMQKSIYGDTFIEMLWGAKFKKHTLMGLVVHVPDFDEGPTFTIQFSLKGSRNPSANFSLIDRSFVKGSMKTETDKPIQQNIKPSKQAEQHSVEVEESLRKVILNYYRSVQDKQVDQAINMYSTEAKEKIVKKRLESIATDTEYYCINRIDIKDFDGKVANVSAMISHKKYGSKEEHWNVNVKLIKENSEWKISSTNGKKTTKMESEQRSTAFVVQQRNPNGGVDNDKRYHYLKAKNDDSVILMIEEQAREHFCIQAFEVHPSPSSSEFTHFKVFALKKDSLPVYDTSKGKCRVKTFFRNDSQGTNDNEIPIYCTSFGHSPGKEIKETFYWTESDDYYIGEARGFGKVNVIRIEWVPAEKTVSKATRPDKNTALSNTYWIGNVEHITVIVATAPKSTVVIGLNSSDRDYEIKLDDIKFQLNDGRTLSASFCLSELMGGAIGTSFSTLTVPKNEKAVAILQTLPMGKGSNFIVDGELKAVSYSSLIKFKKSSQEESQRKMDEFENEKTSNESDMNLSEKQTLEQPAVTIMDSTRAYFLENAHAGQIFVVEGEVSNESSRPISFILLEGKLYTTNNQIAQTQRCYPGNGMPRNELAQLNVTEIQNRMMHREGKNLTNVNIAPSKRIPFMLVFHNLPEMDALGDYSIEVISAKFDK